MLRRIFPRLVPLYLLLFVCAHAQENQLPDLIRRVKPSVASIITYDSKGEPLMTGSGFFLRSGQVITNMHVINGATRADVRTLDGKGKTLKVNGVLKLDEEADLALLSVDDPNDKPRAVEIAQAMPDEGERVLVIGNPLRLEGSISDGIVAAVREVPTLGHVVQITAPISSGSSGSPVFNMKGQVIGVVTIKVTNGQNINLALGSPRVTMLTPGPLVELAQVDSQKNLKSKDEALADWWYKSGLSSLWLGNYDSALDYFKNAVAKNPNRVEAWIEVGFCMVKQGRNAEAMKALQKAIQLRPNSVEAWNKLGDAHYYATQYDEAISAYARAASLRPDLPEAHYNLAMAYLETGDVEAALAQSQLLQKIDPELNKKLLSELKR
jgi:tetratricopeptide (TPR) repeat protein